MTIETNVMIEAVLDRVIVIPDEVEERTPGGIILPDSAQKKPAMGTVKKVGPGRPDGTHFVLPMIVKEGDKVLYGKYSGTEVTVAGQDYVILNQDDILAIIR